MTPHDCATQPVVTTWCETCGHGDESESLDALLRLALTDAVQCDAIEAGAVAEEDFHRAMKGADYGDREIAALSAAKYGAMRDVLIAAILTAARETNNGS